MLSTHRRIFLLCVVFSGSLSIHGCTIPTSCSLLNNSGSNLALIVLDEKKGNHELDIANGSSAEFENCEIFGFEIRSPQFHWQYSPSYFDTDFIKDRGFLFWQKRVVWAQIESNGAIYLLDEEPSEPKGQFPHQPDGFPLKPKQTG